MQQLCLALVSNICPSFSFFSDSIYLMLWKFLSFNIKEKATEGMLKVLCQYWRKIHLTAQMYSAWETRFMRYSEYSEYSLFFFHCAMIDASRYRISLKTFYLSALEASCIAVRKLEIPSLNPPTIVQKAKWSLHLPKYISVCKQNNLSALNLNESYILLHSSTPTLPEKNLYT